jgi:hypothetical protein
MHRNDLHGAGLGQRPCPAETAEAGDLDEISMFRADDVREYRAKEYRDRADPGPLRNQRLG